MNIDKKHLNMKMFEEMTRETLLSFARTRGIVVDSETANLDDLRFEVAQKDAQRFANIGLRVEKKQEVCLDSILKRIEAIEKHLGIVK